jgi:hypothetical protein
MLAEQALELEFVPPQNIAANSVFEGRRRSHRRTCKSRLHTLLESLHKASNAVNWTKLSCQTFKDNQTRLQIFALAYNLANFLRRLALPRDVKHWSLTTLREKLVKIGAKVTQHSKYVTFQLAEVAVTRNLFAAILDRIERLALPPPVVDGRMLA